MILLTTCLASEFLQFENLKELNVSRIPIFVINVRPNRFEKFMSRFGTSDDFEVILVNAKATQTDRDAVKRKVKAKSLEPQPYTLKGRYAIVGHTLASELILREAERRAIPLICIVEDDLLMENRLLPGLLTSINEFKQVDANLLYFGSREALLRNVGAKLHPTSRLSIISSYANRELYWISTTGYAVKRDAYNIITSKIYPINLPYDVYLGKLIIDHHIKGLSVNREHAMLEANDGIHDTNLG
jgi:hypothetical protein